MNFSAASVLLVPAGTASDHAQSQLAFLPSPSLGAGAKPTWSATFDCFGSVTNPAATVASIHMPHLPSLNKARFSLKPFDDAPGGTSAFSRSTEKSIVYFHSGVLN